MRFVTIHERLNDCVSYYLLDKFKINFNWWVEFLDFYAGFLFYFQAAIFKLESTQFYRQCIKNKINISAIGCKNILIWTKTRIIKDKCQLILRSWNMYFYIYITICKTNCKKLEICIFYIWINICKKMKDVVNPS